MGTAVTVRYNSLDGWDLSHPVWVSVIMVNVVIAVYIFFGITILNMVRKFIIIIIKTYYKYKEEK
jgi:purine-cytosine permease-like protein